MVWLIAIYCCSHSRADIITSTITFSNQTLGGFEFVDWLRQGSLPSDAMLLTVSIDVTLNASVNETFANDLTIYVDRLPIFGTNGRLQVGGASNLNTVERLSWANGNSDQPGTTVFETKNLASRLVRLGDAQVYYGNGYNGTLGTSGEFSGSVSLTYFTAVPEPASMTLVLLGSVMAGLTFRTRRCFRRTRNWLARPKVTAIPLHKTLNSVFDRC